MGDGPNGRGGPLAGWVIAISNGVRLLGNPWGASGNWAGKLDGSIPVLLRPFYELNVQAQPVMRVQDGRPVINPQTRQPVQDIQIVYGGSPYLLLCSLDEVLIPAGAIYFEIGKLSTSDQNKLISALNHAESAAKQLRAADSNIAIASSIPPGAKAPGLP